MKCDNKQYTINVTYGNEFDLVLRLKSRTFESSKPIDEDIDATKLENLVVKIGNEVWTDVRTDESGVICHIPADLPIGTYNVYLTATYNGVAIRAAYFECLNIPNWSYKSDAENYLPGSPIVSDAAYIIGGPLTDEEVEELKAELRLKIAAAEEAKEAYEQAKADFDAKAEGLDSLTDVAQETTLTTGIADIREDISDIDFDTSDLAKQGTNTSATNTAILAAIPSVVDVQNGLATEANATANKDAIIAAMPTGYALQGNGNNTLTDLYNLIGYTISEIDAV